MAFSHVDEHIRIMMFIEDAFRNSNKYNLVIRPHPLVPIDKAMAEFKSTISRYEISHDPLEKDLYKCDVMLYIGVTIEKATMPIASPIPTMRIGSMLADKDFVSISRSRAYNVWA